MKENGPKTHIETLNGRLKIMENPMFNVKRIGVVNVLAALALVTACEEQGRNYATKFTPDVERQEQNGLMSAQEAAGDRADATLYADHFDADALNSLGKAKLDSMLADYHSKNPMAVYLEIPNDTDASARQLAVSHYLMDHAGLKASQIQISMGCNPNNTNPVGDALVNYSKTDTASDISSGGGSGSSSGH
jgi:hypothetical protein